MTRRGMLKVALAGSALLGLRPLFASALTGMGQTGARLSALERRHGGRLGVAILDTGTGLRAAHRGGEPFLLCSTFKLLLAAAVLARVEHGEEKLDTRIAFNESAVLDYAPITKQHIGPPGMTIAELCEAAITLSDNTAANLLLQSIGGPAALTRYARTLGDTFTSLDRTEPSLNAYDTTTPSAMLGDMQAVLLGNALSQISRKLLTHWLLSCQTGLQSLRAGIPAGWEIGDKTGQWDGYGVGANNDIAIVWPPGRKPLLVTAYYMNHATDPGGRKAVLAEVGRIVAAV